MNTGIYWYDQNRHFRLFSVQEMRVYGKRIWFCDSASQRVHWMAVHDRLTKSGRLRCPYQSNRVSVIFKYGVYAFIVPIVDSVINNVAHSVSEEVHSYFVSPTGLLNYADSIADHIETEVLTKNLMPLFCEHLVDVPFYAFGLEPFGLEIGEEVK